jgi:biopolymer transport protein ExbB/TolQ
MNITDQFLKIALFGAEWVMYLLVACSVLSLTIIFERILFFVRTRSNFPEFVQNLTERLNSGESLEKTTAWCAGQNTLPSKIASVGLDKMGKSAKAAENAMAATLISQRIQMDKGITILATLASNTP